MHMILNAGFLLQFSTDAFLPRDRHLPFDRHLGSKDSYQKARLLSDIMSVQSCHAILPVFLDFSCPRSVDYHSDTSDRLSRPKVADLVMVNYAKARNLIMSEDVFLEFVHLLGWSTALASGR